MANIMHDKEMWADADDEMTYEVEHPSLPREGDVYNERGINLSAQIRREEKYGRWILVEYSHKKY